MPSSRHGRLLSIAVIPVLVLTAAGGCQQQKVEAEPDYSRQLPPGASALRLVRDPARMPDLDAAYTRLATNREALLDALDESERWFHAPSTKQFFPMRADDENISHAHAHESVAAFREIIESSYSRESFKEEVLSRFDVYESVGWNNEGTVLFTGYYAPVFDASPTQTARFAVPLYTRPSDLVTDPVTGEPRGRMTADGQVVSYYTRREIDSSRMFAGNELVWLEDELSAYIVHVNGSARLRMPDGEDLHIGYAGKTDREYTGLGRSMVDRGLIDANRLSLPAIRDYFRKDPQAVIDLIYRNENYVFFTEYPASTWPAGSLGLPVTPETTLATDKKIYPRGGVVLVDTEAVSLSSTKRRFLQFMLDQDTGGAIRAPGRADIYMGAGEQAEVLAGGQYAEGRLYYFFLKPEHAMTAVTDP